MVFRGKGRVEEGEKKRLEKIFYFMFGNYFI